MKHLMGFALALLCGIVHASGLTQVKVADFEKALPKDCKAWTADKGRDACVIGTSNDQPLDGKQCLNLHYQFGGAGGAVGFNVPVKIYAPVRKLRFWLYGDGSGCGYSVSLTDASGNRGQLQFPPPEQAGGGIGKAMADASGEAHQIGNPQAMKIDFKGWKEIVLDVEPPHELPEKVRAKFDFPLYTQITVEIKGPGQEAGGDLFFGGVVVESDASAEATQNCQVSVVSPEYCSEVKGKTTISVSAPAYKTLTAKCWKSGTGYGTDSIVATVPLDADGKGSFVLPAEKYPHGPITIRIIGDNGFVKDKCNLQLYNKGGISWDEGIPKTSPPPAKGMKLVFADEFSGPPSISATDPKATYYSHKAPNGSTDFSAHRFSDFESPKNPFFQTDTYLRIRASDKLHSSGLLSSIKNDGSGITAKAPCYFECRFIGPSAIGTWPAWWLMTNYAIQPKDKGCDELDIVEGYGGNGPGHPNFEDGFMITPHRWGQGKEGKEMETKAFQGMHNGGHFARAGVPSSWCEAFHTYGCKVTDTDTIYYVDNIEVGRHETFPFSKTQPLFFFINLATGGGWPVDLSRYNGLADMYVDYVRVYQGEPSPDASAASTDTGR